MKKYIAIILFLALNTTKLISQNYKFQQKVNYDISVKLDSNNNTLEGNSKITYFNNSPNELNEIYIYLYLNNYNSKNSALSKQLLKRKIVNLYFSDIDNIGIYRQIRFHTIFKICS